MTLATNIANQSTTTGPFAVAENRGPASLVGSAIPDHASCRLELDRLAREIDPPEVRDIVQTVFTDLLRLLECLSLIERHLRQADVAEETFALFQLIHDEALVLVKFIHDDGMNCTAMSEELRETLDGITFAVNHDLQRVFETGQRTGSPDKTAHVMVGQAYRAHDLLTNCLQQSTITLAMMFDSELVGTRLFNNSDIRYRQSLQLCEDLAALLKLVETTEKQSDGTALSSLACGIEKFRNESMERLMYSDWPQFEGFCEKITVAASAAAELETLLHQFRCYLETLLGHVKMRAVLANVFPVRFGTDDSAQQPNASAPDSTQFSASFNLQDECEEFDVFAIAI